MWSLCSPIKKKKGSVSIQETVTWVEPIQEEKQPSYVTVVHVFKS